MPANDNYRPRDGHDVNTPWFVGTIVALALLSIGFVTYLAVSGPQVQAVAEVTAQ